MSSNTIIAYIVIGILSALICGIGLCIVICYIIPRAKQGRNILNGNNHKAINSHSHISSTTGLDVQLFLENNGIPQYYAILMKIGIDTLDKLLAVDDVILTEQTAMNFEQRHQLVSRIKLYNQKHNKSEDIKKELNINDPELGIIRDDMEVEIKDDIKSVNHSENKNNDIKDPKDRDIFDIFSYPKKPKELLFDDLDMDNNDDNDSNTGNIDYARLKSMSFASTVYSYKPGHKLSNFDKNSLLNSIKTINRTNTDDAIEDLYYIDDTKTGLSATPNTPQPTNTLLNEYEFATPATSSFNGEMKQDNMLSNINNINNSGLRLSRIQPRKLDLNNWENWSSDEICDWIMTLDNGKYKKYERKLRSKFKELNITKEAVILLAHLDWQKTFEIDRNVDIVRHIKKLTNVDV